MLDATHRNKIIVVWGDDDIVVPTHLSEELQLLMPSAKIVVKKGYSHSIPIENGSLVAEELHSFLSM